MRRLLQSLMACACVAAAAGPASVALAGPTADPFSPVPIEHEAPTHVVAVPLSFEALAPVAETFDESVLAVPADAEMIAPEIPLPPMLVPLIAGFAYVGRKVLRGRLPGGR